MLIPINFSTPSSFAPKLPTTLAKVSHDEVVLLELQGVLQVESEHPSDRDGKLVGTLRIDEDLKRPTLQIGYHLIEGKLTTLPKPLAILHRRTLNVNESSTSQLRKNPRSSDDEVGGDDDVTMDNFISDDPETHSPDSEPSSQVQWDAIAVVKRKIVFSKRPMPIVGRPS